MAKTVLQREIARHKRHEQRLIRKHLHREPTSLDLFLEEKVPEKLESTLNAAFSKAFHLIFSKGSSIISKTFSTDKLVEEFESDYAELEELGKGRQMRKFKRRAAASGTAHTLISTVSGMVLGFTGGMIPGIILFNTLLLRNIYQISMKYGYPFDTEAEQKFILRVIEAAMMDGDDFIAANKEINRIIREGLFTDETTVDERINEAAVALAHSQLLMKFLQNIPVVGVVGGASDFIFMERISDYAVLKYQRRFLIDQIRSGRS